MSKRNEKPISNIRTGRSLMAFKVRLFLNSVRSWPYFHLRVPWVKRSGMTHIPWSVELWSPHQDIELGDYVLFGKGRVCIATPNSAAKFSWCAIVATRSGVNRDVEPYAIVAGTLARVVARRFTEDEIRRHEKILGYSTPISAKTKD